MLCRLTRMLFRLRDQRTRPDHARLTLSRHSTRLSQLNVSSDILDPNTTVFVGSSAHMNLGTATKTSSVVRWWKMVSYTVLGSKLVNIWVGGVGEQLRVQRTLHP
jgi:hypothetical protein